MCDIINIRVFCFVTPTLATCSAYRCATVYCICCSLNALEGFVGGVCLLGTRDTTNNPDCYCFRLMWVHDRLLPLVPLSPPPQVQPHNAGGEHRIYS